MTTMATTVRLGELRPLPNSDNLLITSVFGDNGYPCIVRRGDFTEGQLATYVAIDTLVPVADERFKFLDTGKGRTHERVRARRLRGTFSCGLVVPAIHGSTEGEDVSERLGCIKWLPPAEREPTQPSNKTARAARKSETAAFDRSVTMIGIMLLALMLVAAWSLSSGLMAWWSLVIPIAARAVIVYHRKLVRRPHYGVYDIESIRKYSSVLYEGDDVEVMLKLHGMNSSFSHTGRRFHMKSRTTFRGQSGGMGGWEGLGKFSFDDVFKKIAKQYDLERKMKTRPGVVLFGEIVGDKIQDLTYGCGPGEHKFFAFDMFDLKTRSWLERDEFHKFCTDNDIPTAPVMYRGPWSDSLLDMAEGPDLIGKHVREGICITAIPERTHPALGRVKLKLAGQGYLLRKSQDQMEEAAQ